MSDKDAEIIRLRAEVERLSDILGWQCDWFDSMSADEVMYYATNEALMWWKENAVECRKRWDAKQEGAK